MFDEAHHNFHTIEGRYKPFVDLMMNDGYRVIRNRLPFSKTSLSSYKILVISNALGAEEDDDDGADKSAFTEEEIAAVNEWVKGGGSLLLIADHAPFGGAAAALASSFGVESSKGYTLDKENSVAGSPSHLIFSRENKLLGQHSITEGRGEKERLNLVRSFTGQSLQDRRTASRFSSCQTVPLTCPILSHKHPSPQPDTRKLSLSNSGKAAWWSRVKQQ
jgi:hypothetical protein